jgi:RimK family alpha-L-glutamate ligase
MNALITTLSENNNSIRKLLNAFQKFSIKADVISTKSELLSLPDSNLLNKPYDIVINRNLYSIPPLYWDKYVSDNTRQLNRTHLLKYPSYDKLIQYTYLSKNPNIPIIKTLFSRGYQSYENICSKLNDNRFIIKPKSGSLGKGVELMESESDLKEYLNLYNPEEVIYQQYIPIEFDLRIIVLGDKVLGALQRIKSSDSITTNISQGNKGKAYNYSDEIKNLAINVCRELDLEYAGVDILITANNEPLVIEVNQFPHFSGFDLAHNSDTAFDIVNYLMSTK